MIFTAFLRRYGTVSSWEKNVDKGTLEDDIIDLFLLHMDPEPATPMNTDPCIGIRIRNHACLPYSRWALKQFTV